jgi:hypothetical protein
MSPLWSKERWSTGIGLGSVSAPGLRINTKPGLPRKLDGCPTSRGAVQPVGAIGGYDGRECGASVDIDATDSPRRQAAHDALRHSISTQSVGGCIPTRSVRNDRDNIREHAHSHRIRACHGPVDQHTTWTAPKNWMGVPLFGGSPTCGSNRRLRRSRMRCVSRH